jgi:hypothetical protein
VRKLQRQLAGVRLALLHARPELRNTGVRGVMCLAAEPNRTPTELEEGLVLGGSGAAAEIAARPGRLSAEAIAHLRDVLTEHIPRVIGRAIDELQGPPPPLLSQRQPATRGTGAKHGRGRSRQRGRAARLGRSHRRRALGSSVLFTIISAGVAWWGIAHLRLVVPGPVGRVSQLSLARHGHRLAVRYTAAAGDTVRVRIRGAGRARQVELRASGTRQTWSGPRLTRPARPIHVQACVLQSSDRCGPSLTRVLISRH